VKNTTKQMAAKVRTAVTSNASTVHRLLDYGIIKNSNYSQGLWVFPRFTARIMAAL